MGTNDDYCRILVGGSSFSYTLCGERLKPPLRRAESHAVKPAPWCPNGHPSCPACKALDDPTLVSGCHIARVTIWQPGNQVAR
jgi:hypothetical protein